MGFPRLTHNAMLQVWLMTFAIGHRVKYLRAPLTQL